jgi:hypothetical protein
MRITRVREFIARVFVVCLLIVLAIGAALAMGMNIPIISKLLGR